MMAVTTFTPVEQRMLNVLADGLNHTKQELFECLDDDLAQLKSITPHLTRLRRKLNPQGRDIVCIFMNRKTMYRQVLVYPSANDGRT